jgi:hypothetical protein
MSAAIYQTTWYHTLEDSNVHSYRRKNLVKLKLITVALVRKRTIPTERPLHVGEVSANFWG